MTCSSRLPGPAVSCSRLPWSSPRPLPPALIAEAGADRGLLRIRDRARDELYRLCRRLLARIRPDADEERLDERSRRLHVVVDGLAFHLVQERPGTSRRWARSVIEEELRAWSASAD